MHERKKLMAEMSRGFLALPGGYGTLEEVAEVRLFFFCTRCSAIAEDVSPDDHLDAARNP